MEQKGNRNGIWEIEEIMILGKGRKGRRHMYHKGVGGREWETRERRGIGAEEGKGRERGDEEETKRGGMREKGRRRERERRRLKIKNNST